ncbi:hypothetical protein GCM10017673_19960 [Streptosporangium violaceochromogenes]|nr:hypothetical protein GCM10017673_19960 [Streptosporangium violaceochromogenes]
MSYLSTRFAAAVITVALGGALLIQPPATAAAVTTTAAADFHYEIFFPKYTSRGGYLTYTVKVRNRKARGQHYVALVGAFSRHFRGVKVIAKPRSVRCSVKRRSVACMISSLDRGDSTTVKLRGWVGPRRGVAVARFGAVVTDEPGVSVGRLAKKIRRHVTARSKIL